MKVNPGQNTLILFFYFNFILICSFLLFGTWSFFYQNDATTWLEARFSDKNTWEQEYGN